MLRSTLALSIQILMGTSSLVAATDPVEAVTALATRLLGPENARNFVFECQPPVAPETRTFTIMTMPDGLIRITGDDAVTMAAGLNGYLKEVANCHVSWSHNRILLPRLMPTPQQTISRTSHERHGTAFNYCTFNYTMAWWDAERWEQEIDLLALQGIDQPLAIVGTEAIWVNVLNRIGYTPDEARAFIAGPAYTAWWLMGNIEGVGGPVSDAYIASRVVLQKRILARMHELGMRPIFQGFVGLVPTNLGEKKPGTRILPQGQWCGMPRPAVLHPEDPLFEIMARAWYDETEKLYGRADLFGGDLFHEGGNSKGVDVTAMATKVQSAMLAHRPESVWSLQGWSGNPKPSLLKGLRKDHAEVVELCNEYFRNWKSSQGFSGIPWTFGTIIQYGGNIGLHGRLPAIERNLADARASAWPPSGIGLVWESTGINPVTADLLTDLRWHEGRTDLNEWIGDYLVRRYGADTPGVRKAGKLLLKSAYGEYAGHRRPTESIFCARPGPNVQKASPFAASVEVHYDLRDLRDAIELLLEIAPECQHTATYRYDLVDFTRQYLSGIALISHREAAAADKAKDLGKFDGASAEFLEMLNAQDQLLGSEESFLLGRWLADARAIAPSGETDTFELQARSLITTWFIDRKPVTLSDYAWREWSGLLRSYYKPRWEAWIAYRQNILSGKPSPLPDWQSMETDWTHKTLTDDPYPAQPSGDPVALVKAIMNRWGGIPNDASRYQPPQNSAEERVAEEESKDAR